VNQPGGSSVERGRRDLRRFPGLTSDDMAVLRALAPPAARAYENELRRQAASDRRHREHTVSGLDAGELRARQQSRWATGPGGGRHRRPREAPDE
jgi:hypothetical protein